MRWCRRYATAIVALQADLLNEDRDHLSGGVRLPSLALGCG